MKICVLGLGYIGLPTALLLAQKYKVVGVDVNRKAVERINKGESPFSEPGIDDLLEKTKKNIVATTKVERADVFLIAVPTPLENSVKVADLDYIKSAAEMIFPHLNKGNLVILESTVPPGTSERLIIPILEKCGLKAGEFYIVHCPERAIPGNTIYEMIHNDRIIGGLDNESRELARDLYSSFVEGNLYLTDIRTAEFVKLMENTYRDASIALANEFGQMADESGINIWDAIELANKHPRVNILNPGPGVGGHCIAIDPWFLTENSTKCRMVSLARDINNSMPNYVLKIVREMLEDVEDPVITIFGVAYKGDVDDTRETPALKVIKLAQNDGCSVKIYDPYVQDFEYEINNLEDAVEDSDCIVIITDHSEFKEIEPGKISRLMRRRNVVDCRNMLDKERWERAGFYVKVLGDGRL